MSWEAPASVVEAWHTAELLGREASIIPVGLGELAGSLQVGSGGE